jgi:hypothetical protein
MMGEEQKKLWWPFVFDEKVAVAARANRALFKWVLDFFRNVMVVVALAFVALKSGNYLVWSFAMLANFALCAYCYTYIEIWTVRGDLLLSKSWARKLVGVLSLLAIQVALAGISAAMFYAVNKIVTAQQSN